MEGTTTTPPATKGGLSIQYETMAEAEMRLTGTVVLYEGEPVYITRIVGAAPGDPKPDIYRVYAVPLPNAGIAAGRANDEEFRKFISSRKFDMRTIRLGFLNINGALYYCARNPARQQKQGICTNTFGSVPVYDPRGAGGVRLTNLLGRQELVDTIKGIYPTFEEVIDRIKSGRDKALAFSRDYAVVSDDDLDDLIYLYYKTDKVGFVLNDGGIQLSSKTSCLKEALNELGLRV